MPPASASCTFVLRMLSKIFVLPVSTCPMIHMIGQRSRSFERLFFSTSNRSRRAALAAAIRIRNSWSSSESLSSSVELYSLDDISLEYSLSSDKSESKEAFELPLDSSPESISRSKLIWRDVGRPIELIAWDLGSNFSSIGALETICAFCVTAPPIFSCLPSGSSWLCSWAVWSPSSWTSWFIWTLLDILTKSSKLSTASQSSSASSDSSAIKKFSNPAVFVACSGADVVTVSAAWRAASASKRLFSAKAFFFFLSSLIDLFIGTWSVTPDALDLARSCARMTSSRFCSSFCLAESNFPSALSCSFFKRSFSFLAAFFASSSAFFWASASSSAFILASSSAAAAASAAAASSRRRKFSCILRTAAETFGPLLRSAVLFSFFSFSFALFLSFFNLFFSASVSWSPRDCFTSSSSSCFSHMPTSLPDVESSRVFWVGTRSELPSRVSVFEEFKTASASLSFFSRRFLAAFDSPRPSSRLLSIPSSANSASRSSSSLLFAKVQISGGFFFFWSPSIVGRGTMPSCAASGSVGSGSASFFFWPKVVSPVAGPDRRELLSFLSFLSLSFFFVFAAGSAIDISGGGSLGAGLPTTDFLGHSTTPTAFSIHPISAADMIKPSDMTPLNDLLVSTSPVEGTLTPTRQKMTFNPVLTFGAPDTTRAGRSPPQSMLHTISLSTIGCRLQSMISAIKRWEAPVSSSVPVRIARSTFFFFFFFMRSTGSSSALEISHFSFSCGPGSDAGFASGTVSACVPLSSSSETSTRAANFVPSPLLSRKIENVEVDVSTSTSLSELTSLSSSSVAAPMRAAKPTVPRLACSGLVFLPSVSRSLRSGSSSLDLSSGLQIPFAIAARVRTSSSSDP